MIQRIQSLYLILVAVLMGIYMSSPLYTEIAEENMALGSSPLELAGVGVAVLILLLSLGAILLYGRRPLQIKLGSLIVVLHVVLIGLSAAVVVPALQQTEKYAVGFGAILPVISIILAILALRGVKKDEKLVRGADRLR